MTESVPKTDRASSVAFAALVGVVAVLIVLQGVWAGFFIREGAANDDTWVKVHDMGAHAAIVVAFVAAILAIVRLRRHLELVVGSVLLFVLLLLEAYLGGLIGERPWVEELHFPLALVMMGLAVWLPVRSRSLRST